MRGKDNMKGLMGLDHSKTFFPTIFGTLLILILGLLMKNIYIATAGYIGFFVAMFYGHSKDQAYERGWMDAVEGQKRGIVEKRGSSNAL